jgi:16S rRNA (cytosine967-C5)-methyltransferase
MRLKLTQDQLKKIIQTQADILEKAKTFVKEKGFLSYMTCSLTAPENKGQIQTFLSQNPTFKLIKSRQFSPYQTNTDGLFISVLQRQ